MKLSSIDYFIALMKNKVSKFWRSLMANVKTKKSKELLKNSPEVKIILIPAKKIATPSIQKEIQELVAHMVMLGEKKGRPVKHVQEEFYAA